MASPKLPKSAILPYESKGDPHLLTRGYPTDYPDGTRICHLVELKRDLTAVGSWLQ